MPLCLTWRGRNPTLRMLDGAGFEEGGCRVTPLAAILPVGPCRVPASASFRSLRLRCGPPAEERSDGSATLVLQSAHRTVPSSAVWPPGVRRARRGTEDGAQREGMGAAARDEQATYWPTFAHFPLPP